MKTKIFLIAISIIIALGGVKAQKGIDTGTRYGLGDDSIRCNINISLFIPAANSGNFEDAYEPWRIVYSECPASHSAIYTLGEKIIKWQMEKETDPDKIEALIGDLMKLYDDRIKYLGNDPRTKKDYVIFFKARDYYQLKGEKSDHQLVYKWLGDVIEEFQDNTYPNALMYYMLSSHNLLLSNLESYKTQYVNDFVKCSSILDAQLAAAEAANNEKDKDDVLRCLKEIEAKFAISGAADCDNLQNIYASKVEDNKNDLEFLRKTLNLLQKQGCAESDVYITASEYSYKIEPTADAAMGLGSKAMKNNDYSTAEKYFTEALALTDVPLKKASCNLVLATIASIKNQFPAAKQFLQKCIADNPNSCKAYMIWASIYATGAKNLYPEDPEMNKLIYYAVIDKLQKARQVDPSCAEEATKQINTYRQHLPKQTDLFMHPILSKVETFQIPGWVNETVKIK